MQAPSHSIRSVLPMLTVTVIVGMFTVLMVMIQNVLADFIGLADKSLMEFGLRMLLGSFFIIVGWFKVIKWAEFVDRFRRYDPVAHFSSLYGYIYPIIEVIIGISFLFLLNIELTSAIAVTVMAINVLGIIPKLQKKKGYYSATLGGIFEIPLTQLTLYQNLALAVLAGVLLTM